MVHHKETYVPVQGHVREISRAIVVYNARYFVGERAEAKYIGCGFILNVVDEVVER